MPINVTIFLSVTVRFVLLVLILQACRPRRASTFPHACTVQQRARPPAHREFTVRVCGRVADAPFVWARLARLLDGHGVRAAAALAGRASAAARGGHQGACARPPDDRHARGLLHPRRRSRRRQWSGGRQRGRGGRAGPEAGCLLESAALLPAVERPDDAALVVEGVLAPRRGRARARGATARVAAASLRDHLRAARADAAVRVGSRGDALCARAAQPAALHFAR
eukprot:6463941-Prymnesium_polylepis.1